MKVDQVRRGSVSSVKRSKSGGKAVDGSFDSLLEGEIKTDSASTNVKVTALDAIVALHEASAETSENKRAMERAKLMLDRLDDIRQGLLLGEIPRDNLQELTSTVRQVRETSLDMELNDVLDDIELRARVELAKLGTY